MKNIDLELIEKLAENMNKHSLTEISLETGDQKLVLKKEKKTAEIVTAAAPQKVARPVEKVEKKEKQSAEGLSGNIITSPMVGTFYRSPAPGAEVFVQEGQNIKAGDPVCIIEAMKMMNEVNSQFSGKVVRILVEDGVVVQKGDKLFIIE